MEIYELLMAIKRRPLMKKVWTEFKNNHNVIIDVRGLIPEHINALKSAIEGAGVSNRILWYP